MMPPELAAMLQGGGGAPAPDAAPAGGGGSNPGVVDDPRFRQAIQLIEAVARDEPDDQDSALLTEIVAKLYKLAGDRQKEQDDMLQGKASPRALRRAV